MRPAYAEGHPDMTNIRPTRRDMIRAAGVGAALSLGGISLAQAAPGGGRVIYTSGQDDGAELTWAINAQSGTEIERCFSPKAHTSKNGEKHNNTFGTFTAFTDRCPEKQGIRDYPQIAQIDADKLGLVLNLRKSALICGEQSVFRFVICEPMISLSGSDSHFRGVCGNRCFFKTEVFR
jgi:hypothetical protein